MIKLIQFLKNIYVLLLFIVLEAVALNYYANSTSYTKAKLLSASNSVVGGIYEGMASMGNYLSLRRQNRVLLDEIVALRSQLSIYTSRDSAGMIRPTDDIAPYFYMGAHVVNNSITRQENYMTLNCGLRDGMEADMGLISPDGVIAGYVLACSEKYSVCMSVLNTNFRTSGKFKNEEYFGSVYWDGLDHQYVVLSEIPKYAKIVEGDTIVTTDYSSKFPSGITIGTVESWELKNSTYYDVKVKLGTRIASLNDVLVVKYPDMQERSWLENEVMNISK